MLTGNVLITGGAGFLARGIYRRAEREGWPARFTALSRDDAKHAALQKRYPQVQTVLADVGLTSVEHLTDLFRGFDVVIHAAASKYVDRAEHAARDTVQTNLIGSMNVVAAAQRARVPHVVAVSTDKAVAPVNNYGATKFLMERVFQEAASQSPETRFTVARYGNVIGSTGSVIPLFLDWVARALPIKLTDPAMTRYWMSVDEAIDVLLHALQAAPDGSVSVPRCRGLSMRDLALLALGYPGHDELPTDGRVEIVGIRPGEKRHESLMQRQESIRAERSVDGAYFHIAPPDARITNESPFELVSNQPNGWWDFTEMRRAIADAQEV